MPLEILLALVVGGIAGIAVLLRALGMAEPRRFADAAEARAAWLRIFPDLPPRAIHLSADGAAALVDTAAGAGLVWAMGADSTAHAATGARVSDTATGLRIDLPDFAAPRVRVRLSPEARAAWRALIARGPDATAGLTSPPARADCTAEGGRA